MDKLPNKTVSTSPKTLDGSSKGSTPMMIDREASGVAVQNIADESLISDAPIPKMTDDGSSKGPTPKYYEMIINAILELSEPFGSDATSILNYIEQQIEVLPKSKEVFEENFRSSLESLVAQAEIVKEYDCYKVSPTSVIAAAAVAAKEIARAEIASYEADEAVKVLEEATRLHEVAQLNLQFAKDICEAVNKKESGDKL